MDTTHAVDLADSKRPWGRRTIAAAAGAALFFVAFLIAYWIGRDSAKLPAASTATWDGVVVSTVRGTPLRLVNPIGRVTPLPALRVVSSPTTRAVSTTSHASVPSPGKTATQGSSIAQTTTHEARKAGTTTATGHTSNPPPTIITVTN